MPEGVCGKKGQVNVHRTGDRSDTCGSGPHIACVTMSVCTGREPEFLHTWSVNVLPQRPGQHRNHSAVVGADWEGRDMPDS